MSFKEKIVHELKKTALITLYFFVGFNLLALLFALLAPEFRDPATLFVSATLAALVVGKVMVVTEGLLRRYLLRRGTFLSAVLKKSLLFTLVVLVAMAAEEIVHGVLADGLAFAESWEHLWAHASLPRFLARSVYLIVLFALYGFIFELDPYFGNRSVLELVLSKYRRPVSGEFIVMRLGLVDPIPADRSAERAALAGELYHEFSREAGAVGGQLELYEGKRAAVIWPQSDQISARTCIELFQSLASYLSDREDSYRERFGIPLRLRAGVDRGPIQTLEVAGPSTREIIRDGASLDRADFIERWNDTPSIAVSEEFRGELEAAGYQLDETVVSGRGGRLTVLRPNLG